MANPKPLTDEEGEVRELTSADFKQMAPFSALPVDLQELLSSTKRVVLDSESKPKRAPAA